MLPQHHKKDGFTLIELVVLLAIVAILAVIAVPGFGDMIRQNELTARVNDYGTAHRLARSEAVARGRTVTVCNRDAAYSVPTCSADSAWESGWVVFVNDDDDVPATIDPGETVLRVVSALDTKMTLRSSGATAAHVTYRPTGDIDAGGTFVLCNGGSVALSRVLGIAVNGRIRIAPLSTAGIPLDDNGAEIDTCEP